MDKIFDSEYIDKLIKAKLNPVFYDWELMAPRSYRDEIRQDVAEFLDSRRKYYYFDSKKCSIKGKVVGHEEADSEKEFYTSYLYAIEKIWIDSFFNPAQILLCMETKSGDRVYCFVEHMSANMATALKNAKPIKKQRRRR